jgi:arylsulfatase A-like enzyme
MRRTGLLLQIAASGVLVWAALALSLPAPSSADSPPARPNVLFIAVDDLNDWVGPLGGHPQARTPNLDRLATRGLVFTRAYTAAPACNPSRASILCGLRPSTTGVYHNHQPWRRALPEAVTLPQHFRAAGYIALGCGKIYHGGMNDPASWDEYPGLGATPRPADAPAPPSPTEPAPSPPSARPRPPARTGNLTWGPLDIPEDEMPDARNVAWAADFLGRKHEKPFFLAVGLVRPHLPWRVPRKYFELFSAADVKLPEVKENDLDDVPAAGRRMAAPERDHRAIVEGKRWPEAVAAYLASIAFMDAMLGRLLDAFDRSPHAASTIVVLWGDHGWHLGEKEHWRKFALWEEATRVPLIISAPGVTRPGARSERVVSLLDLYPTLSELCGLPPRAGLEGQSLAPLLRDPEAAWERPALMTHGRGNHAVRTERWRYIRYADGSEELYDHQRDPGEWANLAACESLADEKAALRAHLPAQDAADAPGRGAGRRREGGGGTGTKDE